MEYYVAVQIIILKKKKVIWIENNEASEKPVLEITWIRYNLKLYIDIRWGKYTAIGWF